MTRTLRMWPAWIGGSLLLARFVMPVIGAESGIAMLLGPVGALIVRIWWLFLSRAPWIERFVVLAAIAVAMYFASRAMHPSVTGGMMGLMYPIFGLQTVCLALVIWAAISQQWTETPRRLALLAAIVGGQVVAQVLDCNPDRGEWRPQIVTEGRQQRSGQIGFLFDELRGIPLCEELRAFNRNRHHAGHGIERTDIERR